MLPNLDRITWDGYKIWTRVTSPDYYELLKEKGDFEAKSFNPQDKVHCVHEQILFDNRLITMSCCFFCGSYCFCSCSYWVKLWSIKV